MSQSQFQVIIYNLSVSLNMYQRCPALTSSKSAVTLPRTNFGSVVRAPLSSHDKENIKHFRNRNQEKPAKTEYYETEHIKRKPIFEHKDNQLGFTKSRSSLTSLKVTEVRAGSADVRVLASSNLQHHVRSKLEHQRKEQVKSKHSRKKSVRFSEHSLELTQEMHLKENKPRESQQLPRSRSNSILKNKVKSSKLLQLKSESLLKSRGESTSNSNIFSIGQYKNTLVRQRYNHLLKNYSKRKDVEQRNRSINSPANARQNLCQHAKQPRYVDSNFPLTESSIFLNKKAKEHKVEWKRISQIFENKKLLVVRQGESNVTSVKGEKSFANHNFIIALNLLRSNRNVLYRFFQNSNFNQAGVYMLKIFVHQEWKCVIVDDFIPVFCEENKEIHPAFTSIVQLQNLKSDQLEIWPLLLQKAYASVLGSYQRVHEGSLVSYLGQILGLPLQSVCLEDEKNSIWKQSLGLNEQEAIIFGFSKVQRQTQGQRLPFRLKTVAGFKEGHSNSFHFEELQTKMTIRMSQNHFRRSFQELFIIRISTLQHVTITNISISSRFSSIRGRNLSSYDSHLDARKKPNYRQQRPIVKSFSIKSHEQISLILKKKNDSRNNHKDKEWFRVFLFMKQLDSYRWIFGKYGQDIVSFSCVLEAGQYFLVILPDWTTQFHSELTLLLYSRVSPTSLENHHEHNPQTIIEKGCSDYAQRFGKMLQVNRWICTYALVDAECGIVIENINNERRNGKIKVFRSIAGLKPSNCYLLPLNRQFYLNDQLKPQAEISIEKEHSFSVVLFLFGGTDKVFLKTFNFGV